MNYITIPCLDDFEILEERSINQLDTSAVGAFPTTTGRQNAKNPITVIDMQIIPSSESKVLTVKAITKNNENNDQYTSVIQFDKVKYSDPEANLPNSYTFEAPDSTQYTIIKPSSTRTQAKVSCSCLDFYWTFGVYNDNVKSLLGPRPKPYVPKTDRGPRNPKKAPGLCKHLMALTDHLKNKSVIL